MSDSGVHGSDLKRLRHLGALVDAVLVNAADSSGSTFRTACDTLRSALASATAPPAQTIQSLYLAEILQEHLSSQANAWQSVLRDLARYVVQGQTVEHLEKLASSLERERVRAAKRMHSVR